MKVPSRVHSGVRVGPMARSGQSLARSMVVARWTGLGRERGECGADDRSRGETPQTSSRRFNFHFLSDLGAQGEEGKMRKCACAFCDPLPLA